MFARRIGLMWFFSFLIMLVFAFGLMRVTQSKYEFQFTKGVNFSSVERVRLIDWINLKLDEGFETYKIVGHANFDRGDYDANMNLSERRGQIVSKMFPLILKDEIETSGGGNDGSKTKIIAIRKRF